MGGVYQTQLAQAQVKPPDYTTMSDSDLQMASGPDRVKNTYYADRAAANAEIQRRKRAKEAAAEEQRVAPLRAQQNYAKEFEANLPGMQSKLTGDLGNQLNEQMGANIKGIRENAASRGLLRSGLRRSAEGAERAGTAGAINKGSQAIGEALRGQAQLMKDQAISAGLDLQRSQQQIQDQIYSQALQSYQRRSSAMSGLGSAIGMGIGLWAGAGNPAAGMAGAQAGGQLLS